VNANFSQPPLSDPGIQPARWTGSPADFNSIPGWTQTGESYLIAWDVFTTFNKQPSNTYFNDISKNGQVAQVTQGSIYQILSSKLDSGATYTLSVDVGKRNDSPFPGYSVQLQSYNGSTFTTLKSVDPTTPVNPEPGTFSRGTFSFASLANDPHQGETLVVRLSTNGPHTTFDNVSLDEQGTDINVTSAQLLNGNTVQFTYQTTGNPGPFQVGLYRSTDGISYDPTDRIGDLLPVTPSPANPQAPRSFTLPSDFTANDKQFVIVVADPPSTGKPKGDIIETNDTDSPKNNNVAAVMLPDVHMISATTQDSESVTFTYDVDHADLTLPFQVGVYRSRFPHDSIPFDPRNIDPNNDEQIGTLFALPAVDSDGTSTSAMGEHTVSVDLSAAGGLSIDPAHPYVFVVADPARSIAESDKTNDVAHFQIHTIGVVTHGFELLGGITLFNPSGGPPPWESDATAILQEAGFDKVIPFDWSAVSDIPQPGIAISQGQFLASQVEIAASQWDGPVDVQFIGHSRGAVVNNEALKAIQTATSNGLYPQLEAGYIKDVMLDPHPANQQDTFFSFNPTNILSQIAAIATVLFQNKAADPDISVPGNVQDAEVYYQETPWFATIPHLLETILNLQGDVPVAGVPLAHQFPETGIGVGHSEVPFIYLGILQDQLGVVAPNGTAAANQSRLAAASPNAPSGDPAVDFLYPQFVDNRGLAQSFVSQMSAIVDALNRGDINAALGSLNAFLNHVSAQRGKHIVPAAADFLTAVGALLAQELQSNGGTHAAVAKSTNSAAPTGQQLQNEFAALAPSSLILRLGDLSSIIDDGLNGPGGGLRRRRH
jgi:hypothetical protein